MTGLKHLRPFAMALLLGGPLFYLMLPPLTRIQLGYAQAQSVEESSADQLFREGSLHYQQNEFGEALAFWQQSRTIYHEQFNHHAESTVLSMMAVAHIAIGEYLEAIQLSESALPLAQSVQDTDLQVQILGNLGIAYEGAGQYVTALSTYQQTLDIVEQLPTDSKALKRSHILGLMGNTYSSLGGYEQSISVYLEGLKISESINDAIGQITTYSNLGTTYFQVGDPNLALENFENGLRLARTSGNTSEVAYVLSNISAVYRSQENFQQALDSSHQSLELARAEAILDLEVDVLTNLGLIYEDLGSLEQAVDYYEQSLAKAQLLQNPEATAMALNNLGHGLYNSGRLSEAETHLRSAVNHLESLRTALSDTYNISLFDTQIFTYNLLQQVLVANQEHEAALEIAEAGRARALTDLLSSRFSPPIDSSISENAVPQMPLRENIKEIAREQDAVLVEYSLVPEDAFRVQGRQRGNISEIHIWVVQPNGDVDFYSQPIDNQSLQLKELVNQLRSSFGRSQSLDRGFTNASSSNVVRTTEKLEDLHKLLIDPIKDSLPDDPEKKVVFIPHEELFLVPFPALQDESGSYLIERHTILTAPSIQTLKLTREKKESLLSTASLQNPQSLLIVGNPDMPKVRDPLTEETTQLSPLPGAEIEALAIAELFNVEALTGSAASEQAIKARINDASIVHLATHGLLEYGNPEDTGIRDSPGAIALASTSQEYDGLLTSTEIQNDLSLSANLVVLSACDTGRGAITGDGVIGLARAFIAAGTPSVLVSLWAVPDAPTAELMVSFYQELDNGNNKAQALRKAMLSTLKDHPEPKNWAAFTLIGEAE
ncbi:MAG: CHAT domain-containing tetratricopeptide repeat protein [Cyanobacteria bacterium P01_A01_bin.116]